MQLFRHFLSERGVWPQLVVLSTPSHAFSTRFVEARKPVSVQTLGTELAIQGIDIGIIRHDCKIASNNDPTANGM